MSSGGEASDGKDAQSKEKNNDALYEDREPKKIIRLITVTAYMFSVSFVGIVLSAYYIFLWHPPNPRLMHAQAMSVHADARVDYLMGDESNGVVGSSSSPGLARIANNAPAPTPDRSKIDLLGDPQSPETYKIRRDIVKSVNAILRANFEKSRSSGEATSRITEALGELNDSVVTNAPSSVSTSSISSSDSVERKTNSSSSINEESVTTSTRKTTTSTISSTILPPLKRTRSISKRQHQTPFALKHLEVPIKSDNSRRRTARVTTATTLADSSVSFNSRGTTLDKTPIEPPSTNSSPVSDNTSPEESMKSLYRTLTTSSNLRDKDYQSSTDLPANSPISSDQFQAVPRANNDDYRDATIEPADDLMDD